MKRLSREPLFHFLLIGTALFLVYDWVVDDERNDFASGETGPQIVVSAGLAAFWLIQRTVGFWDA